MADDPYLWAATLLEEIAEFGYRGGYSTFTLALRRYQLRPHCEACQVTRGRDVAIIAHPPGEEALCGLPHNTSYEEPGTMRRELTRVLSGGGLAVT